MLPLQNNIITLKEYAMGREHVFPDEWAHVKNDAIKFLEQVNAFLIEVFPWCSHKVESGWRPESINRITPRASERSYHILGRAIDLDDHTKFYKIHFQPLQVQAHADILKKHGLFMEHPLYTSNWMHLDNGARADRPTRVFVP